MDIRRLNEIADFLKNKIDQYKGIKERGKIASYYRELLDYVTMQIPKKVEKGKGIYHPYKCPNCGHVVHASWSYCCKCGNRLGF